MVNVFCRQFTNYCLIELPVENSEWPEIKCLKSKMRSLCHLASLNNWTADEGICISVIFVLFVNVIQFRAIIQFKKNNHLLMNNPLVKCDAMDNVLNIDVTSVDIDVFGVHVADFLLHFLIHDLGTTFSCAIFVYCPVKTQVV